MKGISMLLTAALLMLAHLLALHLKRCKNLPASPTETLSAAQDHRPAQAKASINPVRI